MKFTNLTPHSVSILDNDSKVVMTLAPSGCVARVKSESRLDRMVDGIEIRVNTYGSVEFSGELPDSDFYIVSGMVLEAGNSHKFVAPGELVRDANGQPIGCRGLRSRGL